MTKFIQLVLAVVLAAKAGLAEGASPGNAPRLPIGGTRIVNVATETQLQTAMADLRNDDTILLANGTYRLTRSLYINNRHNVTIRGTEGASNVVLVGKGMDNASYGNVPFGIWSNGTNTTIAHLTLSDTYDNLIILNSGARAPHIYCVKLLNSGSQFIKSNPTDVNAGIGVDNGRVEYCWFEYTGNPPGDHGGGAGYFNGISAHAAHNWIVRGNLFKNLHNPDTAAYLWNPAVLFWRQSTNTITEQNTFINVDRAIAYGLDNTTPYFDHAGGVIRNNFVWLAPGFLSASRKAGSDAPIIAWNSPGTQIDHNTVLLNGNQFNAVQFRFARTTGGTARNNLTDGPIHLRDGAAATRSGNLLNADSDWFVNPASGDLHLLASATNAINQATALTTVTNDFDDDPRPLNGVHDIGADEFKPDTAPRIIDIRVSNTNCVISLATVAGLRYDLLTTTNLTGAAWSALATNIPGTGGIIQVTNTHAPGQTTRFFRGRLSP